MDNLTKEQEEAFNSVNVNIVSIKRNVVRNYNKSLLEAIIIRANVLTKGTKMILQNVPNMYTMKKITKIRIKS